MLSGGKRRQAGGMVLVIGLSDHHRIDGILELVSHCPHNWDVLATNLPVGFRGLVVAAIKRSSSEHTQNEACWDNHRGEDSEHYELGDDTTKYRTESQPKPVRDSHALGFPPCEAGKKTSKA